MCREDALDEGGSACVAPQQRMATLTPPLPQGVPQRAETMAGLEVKPTSGWKHTK